MGSQAFTPQIDEYRKRAGIAYRKAQNAKQHQQAAVAADEPATSMVQVGREEEEEVPPASPSPTPLSQDDLEDDLNIIAKFFADGNDDQTEEEEVIWARLTEQVSSTTEIKHWSDTNAFWCRRNARRSPDGMTFIKQILRKSRGDTRHC